MSLRSSEVLQSFFFNDSMGYFRQINSELQRLQKLNQNFNTLITRLFFYKFFYFFSGHEKKHNFMYLATAIFTRTIIIVTKSVLHKCKTPLYPLYKSTFSVMFCSLTYKDNIPFSQCSKYQVVMRFQFCWTKN